MSEHTPDRIPDDQPDDQPDESGADPLAGLSEALGGALGGLAGGAGGFDLGGLFEQAQQMQGRLLAAQEQLAEETVEGTAGGVTVRLTGTGDLDEVTIPVGAFDGQDADSLTDLGDLIVAAFRAAKADADELATRTLGPMAGGMPGLPGAPDAGPGSPFGFGPTGGSGV